MRVLYPWDAVDLGNCPKSSRKWLGEGATDPASKRPLAMVRNGVAPVQKRVWVVQKTLGRPSLPGPKRSQKDLLHPPLITFGDFPFLGNFPGPQHPNSTPPAKKFTYAKKIPEELFLGLLRQFCVISYAKNAQIIIFSKVATWKSLLFSGRQLHKTNFGELISWQVRNFAVVAPQNYIKIFWANYFRNIFAGRGGIQIWHCTIFCGLDGLRNMSTQKNLREVQRGA